MKKTEKLNYLLTACAAGAVAAGQAASEERLRPNLIVIMTDDQGYADVGFHGCTDIPTPNIDRIAANGVVCSSAYVTYSICGPSRAGFLTGRYQQRFGFHRNPPYRPDDPTCGLPLSETNLAEALGPAGYRSGIIGKWHMGAHESLHPLNRGFDEFFGHLGGGHRYFPEELTIRDSADAKDEYDSYRTWILRDHEPVQIQKYLTDEFSDEAAAFIKRNKDYPFFLFLAYNAPHAPLQASEEYLARFTHIEDETRRVYAAMVSAVDDGVGQVLDTLEQLNLQNNTLVFFLSDNGGRHQNSANNYPLRGSKSDIWEGGFRVPFAVQWPGTLPSGVVYDPPVSSMDIFATITEMTDYQADPNRPLDGVNLIPYLTGKKDGSPPHKTIYLRKYDQDRWAVRHGDYKIAIHDPSLKPRLFNLVEDISEQNNLMNSMPEKLQELDQLRLEWKKDHPEPTFDRIDRKRGRRTSGED